MLEALRRAERQVRPGAAGVTSVVRESVEQHGASGYAELSLEPVPEPIPPAATADTAMAPGAKAAIGDAAPKADQGTDALGERRGRSRRPFVLALGLLGVLALAMMAYFWLQLQPKPPMEQAKPVRPVENLSAAPAAPLRSDDVIPGLPPPSAARTIVPEQVAPRTPASSTASARVTPVPAPDPGARPAAAMPARPASNRVVVARIHSEVASGYAAYQAGELGIARSAYEQALREEPGNRDAILGLAALDIRARRFDQAEAHYENVLRMFPRDPHALAGLMALQAERVDPLRAESSLKMLLAADPDAAPLQFSLGNQFARQARWAEAQQAYTRALTGDPDNPDAAFNLAVSHDRLHQPVAAKEQYERALRLAERRAASFSPEVARLRLLQLQN